VDSTVTAVPDMVLGHQILWIQIPFHAVGRGRFAETPQPLQGELGIRIDNRGNGVIQIFLGRPTRTIRTKSSHKVSEL
jgi:hypothetical protein